MLVWATIAALLVLVLAALLGLVWAEEPVADDASADTADRPPDAPRGVVTPDYLREVRVPGHGRGYHRQSVDVLLERAAAALEQATASSGEEVEDRRGDEAGGLDR
jgi:hypothetical protein